MHVHALHGNIRTNLRLANFLFVAMIFLRFKRSFFQSLSWSQSLRRRLSIPSAFADVLKRDVKMKTLETWKLYFVEDPLLTRTLVGLKNPDITSLPCGRKSEIEAITVDTLGTVYARSFYYRLFRCLRKSYRSVLTGNPGTSKSWFQW